MDLRIELDSSREITRKVSRGSIDFGIVVAPEPFQSLVIRPLKEETVGFYTREGKLIQNQPILYQPEMVGIGRILRKHRPKRTLAISNYEVIASIASQSRVAALLPSGVADRFPALKQVGPSHLKLQVSLVYNGLYAAKNLRNLIEGVVVLRKSK